MNIWGKIQVVQGGICVPQNYKRTVHINLSWIITSNDFAPYFTTPTHLSIVLLETTKGGQLEKDQLYINDEDNHQPYLQT